MPRWCPLKILAIAIFVVACIVNPSVTTLIMEIRPHKISLLVGFFCVGFLVCEIALLGFLLTFWKVHFFQRLATVVVMLGAAISLWIFSLTDYGSESIPVQVLLILYSIAFVGIALQWAALKMASRIYRKLITRTRSAGSLRPNESDSLERVADPSPPASERRFGIGFLLALVTSFAFLAMLHKQFEIDRLEVAGLGETIRIIALAFCHTIISVYAFTSIFMAAGVKNPRWWFMWQIVGTISLGIIFYSVAATLLGRWFHDGETAKLFVSYYAGVILSGWMACALLILSGFSIAPETPATGVLHGSDDSLPSKDVVW